MLIDDTPPAPHSFKLPDGRPWFRVEYIEGMWEAVWPDEAPRPHYPARVVKVSDVYFIGGETGPIKIGESSNVRNRFSDLQASSPVVLSVLATCPGGSKAEREYHRRFASARLHGEWFSRTPEIEAEISKIRAEHGIPAISMKNRGRLPSRLIDRSEAA